MERDEKRKKGSFFALTPLIVFLGVYLVLSVIINDFYKVPLTIAFIIASFTGILITRKHTIDERIFIFSEGAANRNILLMVWIFILAGAFAQSARDMGAIDATVNLCMKIMPGNLLFAGIFISACFISLSVGTSVGTIVALTPIAVGIAEKTGADTAFITAIVVGGAFFGDNLSFISDTTIAATKTQGCSMRDKFKVNIRIVLPAAILVLFLYIYQGLSISSVEEISSVEWVKILPYLVVLITALTGMNVLAVLFIGLICTGIIGLLSNSFVFFDWLSSMDTGIKGMGELIIVTLMAGGLLEIIRYNGGIEYIIRKITRHVNSKRGAELAIAILVSIANFCTANNTIAVLTTGPIARDIADRFHVDKRKSASILDTFSCFIQGILPYGAQILMAVGLSQQSPFSIIKYLYYPFLMGIFAVFAIIFRYPRKYS